MRNDRREQILSAARERFARQGYAATSMSEIRRDAGASTGSLYHHFGGKEHLGAALVVEAVESFHEHFVAALQGARTARSGVRAGVRGYLTWVAEDPDRARLLITGLDPAVGPLADPRRRELNRAFFLTVRGHVERWIERGDVRRLPDEVWYALWIGPAAQLSRRWLQGRLTADLTRIADQLADGAWLALRAA